jgi:predicted Rossmann fold flavoprotein
MSLDVVILGAGAAGLMCGIESAKRKKNVLIIEKSQKIGEKIRISGGGRCNFTNINTHHSKFISKNPSFVISSLNQYSHSDFIELVKKYKISFHEKKLGQLFCDGSSQQIIDLLLSECQKNNVRIEISTSAEKIEKKNNLFFLKLSSGTIISTKSLVIATGGLSIPKIGASDFGYSIAKQFDLKIIPTKPALVPFVFNNETLAMCRELSGISIDSKVSFKKTSFNEDLLFTHRGLSGPSILQISSYWKENNFINVNINPEIDYCKYLLDIKLSNSQLYIQNILSETIPKRLVLKICELMNINGKIIEISNRKIEEIGNFLNNWSLKPIGTEGYRTAEVTCGGVDTDELSSKTMMSNKHHGLFFIGEVVDVTGHLGGYNFQWAWSSGYVAGQYT